MAIFLLFNWRKNKNLSCHLHFEIIFDLFLSVPSLDVIKFLEAQLANFAGRPLAQSTTCNQSSESYAIRANLPPEKVCYHNFLSLDMLYAVSIFLGHWIVKICNTFTLRIHIKIRIYAFEDIHQWECLWKV